MKKNILIVDDEELNRNLIKEVLTAKGYNAITAEDGIQALELVKVINFHCILLDIMMPEMDGYETIKKIKEIENSKDVPVIFLTALNSREEKLNGIKLGAVDFLTKPIDFDELLLKIKNYSHQKELFDRIKELNEFFVNFNTYSSEKLKKFKSNEYNIEKGLKEFISEVLTGKALKAYTIQGLCVGKIIDSKRALISVFKSGITDSSPFMINKKILQKDLPFFDFIRRGKFFYNIEYDGHLEFPAFFYEIFPEIYNFIVYKTGPHIFIFLNINKEVTENDVELVRAFLFYFNFFQTVVDQTKKLRESYRYLAFSLAKAAEVYDDETGQHILRINEYSRFVAETLNAPSKFVEEIGFFAQLHDIGKLHIPPEILRKPGRLFINEFEEMKKHTIYGSYIIGDNHDFKVAKNCILTHHENYDGTGYPYGLKGDNIPMEGRILKLVDVYDALRSKRAYKSAFSHQKTVEIMTVGDGRVMPEHFDPQLLNLFKKHHKSFEEIFETMNDKT